ncbi:MAG TPA: DUF4340 domain-containing protein [Thermoanaerobaculia bacterium]|nr:DUF4340 domain-containing protein [Thermoanaerobaculia bacterium]
MRPRTLLVLLIVVAALAAFIRFYERDLPSSDERAQRAKKVLDFKKDQVNRVRLTAAGTTVVLERQPAPGATLGSKGPAAAAKPAATKLPEALAGTGAAALGDWRIAQPLLARADAAAVDRLLDSLANLEKTRTLARVAPAEMGLDKPRAVVALSVAGARGETVLEIGAGVPTTTGQAIVAVAGRPQAYVVNDALLADVTRKPGEWRDRQMFHGDRDAVERLAWTVGSGPRVVLARRGDRFWLESPLVDRADRDQVEKLLSDLMGLNADTFLDTPPSPAVAPRAVLEAVVAGQPEPFRVELGASRPAAAAAPQPGAPEATGTLTAARAGATWFETRSTLPETLARPPADWRSPLLSGLEVHQVDAAVVHDVQGTVALTRSGTDWKRGAATISYLPVSDLLFAVTEAKADRLLNPAEAGALGAGAGKPALTLELKGGQAGSETLSLYPPLAGATHGVPARAGGRDTVLLLPETKLKDIRDRLDAVRAAKPLPPEKPAKK